MRNLALIASANVVVELKELLRGTHAITHRLDDSGAFEAALLARLANLAAAPALPSVDDSGA